MERQKDREKKGREKQKDREGNKKERARLRD